MKTSTPIALLLVCVTACFASDINKTSEKSLRQDSLVQLASRYYNDGEFKRVISLTDPADTLSLSPKLLYYQGMSYSALYDYPRAIECFQKSLIGDSTKVNVRFQYSRLLIQSGFLERAANELSTCTRLDSAYLPAWFQLGLLYNMQKNDNEKELEIFSYLVRQNPDDFVSLYYLGDALRRTELQDSGLACIRRSIAINQQYYPSLIALANAYVGKNQYTPALEFYRKAQEIRPHDKDLLIKTGECLRKSGAFHEAISCFKTVIAMDSINDAVHAQMGLAYYSLGKYDSSVYCYAKAIALEKDNVDYYKNIAIVYQKMDSVEAAVRMSKKRIEVLHPEDVLYARTSLASLYTSKKRTKDAVSMYKQNIADAYMELATYYQSNSMRTEAIAIYQRMQELEPGNNDFQFRVAYLYEEMHKYKEAIQIYTKIMQPLPPEAQKSFKEKIESLEKKAK